MKDIVALVITVIISWSMLGLIIGGAIFSGNNRIAYCRGLECLGPKWIYKHYHVNWFGAFWLTVLFNLICPIASIAYWFYRLCTVGRK